MVFEDSVEVQFSLKPAPASQTPSRRDRGTRLFAPRPQQTYFIPIFRTKNTKTSEAAAIAAIYQLLPSQQRVRSLVYSLISCKGGTNRLFCSWRDNPEVDAWGLFGDFTGEPYFRVSHLSYLSGFKDATRSVRGHQLLRLFKQQDHEGEFCRARDQYSFDPYTFAPCRDAH